MIRYFISYAFHTASSISNGNAEIRRSEPIRSMDDIAAVTELLRRQGFVNPLVLSFSRFEEPDSPTGEDRDQPGPVDNLTFDYIRQLLQEQARALTADQIADMLGFPVDAVRRITQRAVDNRRLLVTDGRYSLPHQGGRR